MYHFTVYLKLWIEALGFYQSVQVSQTSGLYVGSGVYPGPGLYVKFVLFYSQNRQLSCLPGKLEIILI